MSVVFFISGHGFGHASRQVEIINALARAAAGPARSSSDRPSTPPCSRARCAGPFELRPGACDTGIVQATSVAHDDEATVREAIGSTHVRRPHRRGGRRAGARRRRPDRRRHPAARVRGRGAAGRARRGDRELHVGLDLRDASGHARGGAVARAAHSRGVREGRRSRSSCRSPAASRCFPTCGPLPLVARQPTRDARRDARALRPAARSAGGAAVVRRLRPARRWISTALDCLGRVDGRDDRSDRSAVPDGAGRQRVVLVPEEASFQSTGFRYEDLVAAVDVVMTKPGYGIIAECIAAGTAMLYTSRGEFREYDRAGARPAALRAQPVHQSGRSCSPAAGASALDGVAGAARAGTRTMATDRRGRSSRDRARLRLRPGQDEGRREVLEHQLPLRRPAHPLAHLRAEQPRRTAAGSRAGTGTS